MAIFYFHKSLKYFLNLLQREKGTNMTTSNTIPAGTTVSGMVVSGTTQIISGIAKNTTVIGSRSSDIAAHPPGGNQIVASGGIASQTRIPAETYQAGMFVATTSASQTVQDGGKAFNTSLSGAISSFLAGPGIIIPTRAVASQTVESGGFIQDTALNGGSVSIIYQGGSATNTILTGYTTPIYEGNVRQGGYHLVNESLYGQQTVYGVSDNIQVNGGGFLDVENTGSATHVTVLKDGYAVVGSGATLADATVTGGSLTLVEGAILTTPITINENAHLYFENLDSSQGKLSANITSDSINSNISNLEIFSGGTIIKDIPLQGKFPSPLYFTQTASGNSFDIQIGTPCYFPGTLIATPTGDRPIEHLVIGDSLLTANGKTRPIKWIGRRSYEPMFAYGNRDVLPILFRKGSLGNTLPRRDLTISPLHAMFVDGYLIPALHLVNGLSIIQIEKPSHISYIHIELETHDILLAEGAPSESFLDDSSRGMFHNAHEYSELYPNAPVVPVQYCAPRLEDGEELARIHQRLKDYAQQALSEKAA